MKFWDSSALVPLLLAEDSTPQATALALQDAETVVWWATPVECASAIARVERNNELSSDGAATATLRSGHTGTNELRFGLELESKFDRNLYRRRL